VVGPEPEPISLRVNEPLVDETDAASESPRFGLSTTGKSGCERSMECLEPDGSNSSGADEREDWSICFGEALNGASIRGVVFLEAVSTADEIETGDLSLPLELLRESDFLGFGASCNLNSLCALGG
jgi:hypothetical protein